MPLNAQNGSNGWLLLDFLTSLSKGDIGREADGLSWPTPSSGCAGKSTALTLVVIPAVYSLVKGWRLQRITGVRCIRPKPTR